RLEPALAAASPAAHAGAAFRPAPVALRAGLATRFSPGLARAAVETVPADATPHGSSTVPAAQNWKFRAPYLALAVVESTPLPGATPSSDSFSVSFDYCLVTIARPWISSGFLTRPGWYVPGQAAASWALGKYDAVTQGFGYLPAKMLVVKNLKITANWSQED